MIIPFGFLNKTVSGGGGGGTTSISSAIIAGLDDVEEIISTATVSNNQGTLNLCYNGTEQQLLGFRFTSLNIPATATITSAYIQFQSVATNSDALTLRIRGGLDLAPTNFDWDKLKPSERTPTTSFVDWACGNWYYLDKTVNEQTSDISVILQEIIENTGYNSADAIVILIKDETSSTASRLAKAYNWDNNTTNSPKLYIEYTY